jgi:hypothetical protein
MALLTRESSAAWTALAYITIGALVIVWTAVFFAYEWNTHGTQAHSVYYWCAGFLATGLVLLGIGFSLGHIGRAARRAELPPQEVTKTVAQTEQTEAAPVPSTVANTPVNPAAQPQIVMLPVAPTAQLAEPSAQQPGVVNQTPARR